MKIIVRTTPNDWSIKQWLHAPTHHAILLATQHQHPAGLLCFSKNGDEYEILQLVIATRFRRQAVATALVSQLIKITTTSLPIKTTGGIFLEVRRSNIAAISLYQKLGFHVIGERARYYRDGEDALRLHFPMTRHQPTPIAL